VLGGSVVLGGVAFFLKTEESEEKDKKWLLKSCMRLKGQKQTNQNGLSSFMAFEFHAFVTLLRISKTGATYCASQKLN
jgi:hypothetical protein